MTILLMVKMRAGHLKDLKLSIYFNDFTFAVSEAQNKTTEGAEFLTGFSKIC